MNSGDRTIAIIVVGLAVAAALTIILALVALRLGPHYFPSGYYKTTTTTIVEAEGVVFPTIGN